MRNIEVFKKLSPDGRDRDEYYDRVDEAGDQTKDRPAEFRNLPRSIE